MVRLNVSLDGGLRVIYMMFFRRGVVALKLRVTGFRGGCCTWRGFGYGLFFAFAVYWGHEDHFRGTCDGINVYSILKGVFMSTYRSFLERLFQGRC